MCRAVPTTHPEYQSLAIAIKEGRGLQLLLFDWSPFPISIRHRFSDMSVPLFRPGADN